MPVRPSRSSTSLPGAASDPRLKTDSSDRARPDSENDSRWRDGRSVGRHIVDRALDYAALHGGGLTAAQIARRRKRSKGYVSIVLRLGTTLQTLDREEIAVFRSERITWKLAQRIVRADITDAEIQRQLRYALGGFSTHNMDGRKLRTHRKQHRTERRTSLGGVETVTSGSHPEQSSGPGAFVWQWDAEWVGRDPEGYVDAYRTHLTSLHRAISTRFREAIARRATPPSMQASIPLAGQSLSRVMALVAQQRRSSQSAATAQSLALKPEQKAAMASLAAIDGILKAIAHEIPPHAPADRPGSAGGARGDRTDDRTDDNDDSTGETPAADRGLIES